MTTAQQSPLISLPPELRIMIYDCVFETLPQTYHDMEDFETLEPTSLTQVCRLMRAEATPKQQQWILANAKAVLHDAITPAQVPVDHGSSAMAQIPSDLVSVVSNAHNTVMHLQANKQTTTLKLRGAERKAKAWLAILSAAAH